MTTYCFVKTQSTRIRLNAWYVYSFRISMIDDVRKRNHHPASGTALRERINYLNLYFATRVHRWTQYTAETIDVLSIGNLGNTSKHSGTTLKPIRMSLYRVSYYRGTKHARHICNVLRWYTACDSSSNHLSCD
jgi:hypothetical protein